MTSRTDERCDPQAGRAGSHATRLTLLGWLLVLSIAASAECAWVLWFQHVWAMAPAEPSWLSFPAARTSAARTGEPAARIRDTETE